MDKFVSRFESFSKRLDSLGVESKGIHRYLPSERSQTPLWRSYLSISGLWLSGCGGLTSMSSFFLGPLIFGLGYKDTLILGLLGELVGCVFAAYCATMGPRSGLRQMCSARYLFGKQTVRLVSLITIVGFLGWSITNCVLGGEILKWISNGKVSLSSGIVIINIISLVVALFGIDYVLKFEGIIGIAVFIVIILLWIIVGDEISQWTHLETVGPNTLTIIGNRISFFTLAYSVTATWGGCAADYYVVFPEHVSQLELATFTFFGLALPTTFGGCLGMLIGNAAVGNQLWNETYTTESLGGLLNLIFGKWNGFGKFLLVVLWLSLITNNVINTYSSALSFQLLDDLCYRYLPRWFIAIIIFAITLICSLVGKDHFSEILSNFLPMLGYWISIYFILLFEENVIFRSSPLKKLFRKELYGEIGEGTDDEENQIKKETPLKNIYDYESGTVMDTAGDNKTSSLNEHDSDSIDTHCSKEKKRGVPPCSTTDSVPYYNFDAWNDYLILTNGFASSFAFCCGVAGAVVGMNQVYYRGPIASYIGEYGGDIGNFLAIGFAGVTYPACRYIELRLFGK